MQWCNDCPKAYDDTCSGADVKRCEAERKARIFNESMMKQKPYVEKEPVKIRPVNQWISVNDRLPEIGRSVLVAVNINAKLNLPFRTDSTPEIRIGWLDDNGKWGLQFDSADRDEILYWQPLPEPPKDGEQNENN
jgi:hypothetical protein